jgi:hypothetical protein
MTGTAPLFPVTLHTAVGTARSVASDVARWSADRFFPDGGQRTARRNAWVAMGVEARLARDRREAEAALLRAAALAAHPAQGPETASLDLTAVLLRTAPAAAEAARSV